MTPLRVVHVVDREAPSAVRLCDALRARLPTDEFEQDVEPRGRGTEWLAAIRAARRVRREAYDVVHLWDRWSVRRVGPLLGRGAGREIVCTVHTPRRSDFAVDHALERRTLRRATRIVSHDVTVRSFELRRHACCAAELADRWIVLPDGVDALADDEIAAARTALRAELRLPVATRLLGVVCRQTPDKNVRDLIWITTLLRVLHDDVRTVVVGTGPQHEALRRYAQQLRVDDLVHFYSGAAPVERVIAALDFYVDAARWDGPAAAVNLAQAAGVPALCVDTPVRARQIDAGRSGFLFAEHDRATLVRRLHALLVDREAAAAMSRHARTRTAERPTLDAVVERYADVYRCIRRRTG